MRYFKRESGGDKIHITYYRVSNDCDCSTYITNYEYYIPHFNEWALGINPNGRRFSEYVYTEITEGEMMLEML